MRRIQKIKKVFKKIEVVPRIVSALIVVLFVGGTFIYGSIISPPTVKDDKKYYIEFTKNLASSTEWKTFATDTLTVPVPARWIAKRDVGSHYPFELELEPEEQDALYFSYPQIFLPHIQVARHRPYICAVSGTTLCNFTDDTSLPSTPEKYLQDLKAMNLYDPHCRCTTELDPQHLKGLDVNAYVFLQGNDSLEYIFLYDSHVYTIQFFRSRLLTSTFIEDFVNNVRPL
jgi:hypothetical protein